MKKQKNTTKKNTLKLLACLGILPAVQLTQGVVSHLSQNDQSKTNQNLTIQSADHIESLLAFGGRNPGPPPTIPGGGGGNDII